MSQLGRSNVNVNVNVAGGLATAGVAVPARMNTFQFPKLISRRSYPFDLPGDATAKEKELHAKAVDAARNLRFREYWDAELQASVYVNEFVAKNPSWLEELATALEPGRKALRKERDKQLQEVMALSDEREARFAEIIDQHTGEGALKYWLGMLMIDASSPRTLQLVHVGRRLGELVVMCLKDHFGEPRPSQVCPAIVPMIDPPITPAYPAGHALQSHLISKLIEASYRVVSQSHVLFALSHRVAENRVVAGLHYPIDNEAGVVAAEAVYAKLMSDEAKLRCDKFRALLDAARDENTPKPQTEPEQ